jgi:hypothetical protein
MVRRAPVAATLILALAITGCGKHRASDTSTNLPLQRTDLVLVSGILRTAEPSVSRAVDTSRYPWSLIAHGLPAKLPDGLRERVARAARSASEIRARRFMTTVPRVTYNQNPVLTGPGAGIAGLFQKYATLSQRGWSLTEASIEEIEHGRAATAGFLRSNARLYVACIYDGQFDLSLIGKNLRRAYERLGGERAFGGTLPQAQLEALANFYDKPLRLQPHSIFHFG